MPQMSPLNWLMLFIYFLIIYMIYNLLNYCMFIYIPKINFWNSFKPKYNWKW